MRNLNRVWILIVVACLILQGCTVKHAQPHLALNPHPKYFVTITGNIQPHMPYPMTVMFKAVYAGYHPKCQVWVNKLEGVPGLPGHHVIYTAHPNAQGNYKVKIPIDAYKPGKCDWKMAWIMAAIMPSKNTKTKIIGQPWLDVIHFGGKNNLQEQPSIPFHKVATTDCGKGGFQSCNGTFIQAGYVKFVSRKKSYLFEQNVKSQGRIR